MWEVGMKAEDGDGDSECHKEGTEEQVGRERKCLPLCGCVYLIGLDGRGKGTERPRSGC